MSRQYKRLSSTVYVNGQLCHSAVPCVVSSVCAHVKTSARSSGPCALRKLSRGAPCETTTVRGVGEDDSPLAPRKPQFALTVI